MGWGLAGRVAMMLWTADSGLLAAGVVQRIPAPSGWAWPERTRDVVNHWSDAFNFLDLIPGPAFLLLFIIYAVAVTALCWLLRNILIPVTDQGLVNPAGRLPFSQKPGFLDVAYLRDGRKGMLIAAVCNLVRLGIITPLFEKLPDSYAPRALRGQPRPITELEQAIADAVDGDVSATALREDAIVNGQLARAEATARAKLDALGLSPTPTTRLLSLLMTALALLLVDGLAVVRVIRSNLRGYYNLELLIFLTLVVTVGICMVMPRVRYSGSGARFINRLRADAAGVIRSMQAMTKPGDNADVMYAMAACGMAAVKGTLYYEVYERMFPEPVTYSSSSSSDSCSSCSGGSCGGGSCGGGGCGGGGCGGG